MGKKFERESQFYDSPPRNNAPIRGKGRAREKGRGHNSSLLHIQCHYCKVCTHASIL